MQPYRVPAAGAVSFVQVLRCLALVVLIPAILLSLACGGGSSKTTPTGPAPTFTSKAPTLAREGVAYTYDITTTTTDNSTVTYKVTTGPTGAAISGSTLTWTPTHAQSRTSNSFTITATTSANGTATQVFSITPNGIIDGTAVYHAIIGTGLQNYPQDLSSATIEIFLPDGKGGFTRIKGSGDSSGNFTVPNIPASTAFWLHLPRTDNGFISDTYIWTNASDVDAGQLIIGRSDFSLASSGVTVVPDATLTVTRVAPSFAWKSPDARSFGTVAAPATSPLTTSFQQMGGLLDQSKGDRGFLLHYETSGLISNVVESQTVDSITETDGGTTNLPAASMTANTGSTTDPNIKITQFDAINAALPGTTTPLTKNFTLYDTGYAGTEGWLPISPADNTPLSLINASLNSVTTDTDLGSISYGLVSKTGVAYAQLTDLGSRAFTVGSSAYVVQAVGTMMVSNTVPTASNAIVPVLTQPLNPTIDGKNLLGDQSNLSLTPKVAWNPPAVGPPTAYELIVLNPASPSTPHYFFTNGNSVAIPPGVLQANSSYVFILQAITYQNSSFTTAPFRMGTSCTYVGQVSGLMTTGAGSVAAPSSSTPTQVIRIVPAANGRITVVRQ
jgi:hypothetical protein